MLWFSWKRSAFTFLFFRLFSQTATVSSAGDLETEIINANAGSIDRIEFTTNISYSQQFRPLNCDGAFVLQDKATLLMEGDLS